MSDNPLSPLYVAKRRLVEEVMAIHGRSLETVTERFEYRHLLESYDLDKLAALRDELLDGPVHAGRTSS